MKPNEQQKQWLQDYLRAVLTYRETYEEVYDHMITALDNKPLDRFFETTVIAIIEDDFGGSNGLAALEQNFEYGFSAEINTRYNSYFNKKWLNMYIMEMLTTLFRAKLTTGLADFWVAANAIKACTKIVI